MHGITDKQNYKDIANAIREKNGSQEVYKPNEMASAIEDLKVGELDFSSIYDQEQAKELNQYYKDGIAYAEDIARRIDDTFDLYEAFKEDKDLIYMPNIDLEKFTNQYRSWQSCIHLEVFPKIKKSNIESWSLAFQACFRLKEIEIDLSKAKNINYILYNCYSLRKIKFDDITNVTSFSSSFVGLSALQYCFLTKWKQGSITFPQSSLLLPESIHYIIQNALENVNADGTPTRTLTLHATAKTNWQNSEYYKQDLAVLPTKGITIA